MKKQELVNFANKRNGDIGPKFSSYEDYINWQTITGCSFESFYENFNTIYQKIVQIDMYEGWVLKKRMAKLKNGLSEKNNTDSQMKFRKPTKNYSY